MSDEKLPLQGSEQPQRERKNLRQILSDPREQLWLAVFFTILTVLLVLREVFMPAVQPPPKLPAVVDHPVQKA